jgi:hypothetical protein
MHQRVSEADHADPFFAERLGDVALFEKKLRNIALPVHHPQALIGDDVVAHIEQGFDGKMQKALGAAVALGIRQELLAPVAAKLAQNAQVLIELVQAFAEHLRSDHGSASACRPRAGP